MSSVFSAEYLQPVVQTALQDPGEQGNQARQLMDKLQNRADAWSISALLTLPTVDVNVRFYAAATLKHKIIHDLRQLGEPEVRNLQNYLMHLTATGERMVSVQVELALAALFVQLPECEEIIRGLCQAAPSLALLGMIPEQSRNRRIPKKYPIAQSTVQLVLDTFLSVLQEGNEDQSVLDGLGNWIDVATEDGGAISSPHLLKILFNLLVDGEDSIGEVLSNVIYLNSVREPNREWLEMLGHGVLSLSHSQEPELRWAVEVMAEAATSHLDFVLSNRDALLQPIVQVLLRGVSDVDRAIAEATLGTWDALSDYPGLEQLFLHLFKVVISGPHLKYPAAAPSQEELDDFRDFRHVIGDTLKTCVRYLGSTEALQVVLHALENSGRDEQTVESLLFVMRTVASAVDRRETEVLPRILHILLSPALEAAQSKRLRYAKNLVIGCYSVWANAQGRPVVQELCRYLFSSFSSFSLSGSLSGSGGVDQDIVISAAMALMFMAESNARCFPLDLLPEMEAVLERAQLKVRGYLCEALGIVHACNHTLSDFVTRTFLARFSAGCEWIDCYGKMVDALKSSDLWDVEERAMHVALVAPVLLALPVTDESFLEALCPECLSAPVLLEFVQRGYIQERKPFAIRALNSVTIDDSTKQAVNELLNACAAHLLRDDLYDFVKVLANASAHISPHLVHSVVSACIADPQHAQQANDCAAYLALLLPLIPDDLLVRLLSLALHHFSHAGTWDFAKAVWRGKRATVVESLVRGGELVEMTEVERLFWISKVREASHADHPRPMKDTMTQLGDLVKRRLN